MDHSLVTDVQVLINQLIIHYKVVFIVVVLYVHFWLLL